MNHENTIAREGAGNHTEGLSRVSLPHATTGAVSGDGCSSARTVHLLTSSRLKCWQSCPRAHHYRYEVGLAPVDEPRGALAFGTAIHAGLEAWWLSHREGEIEGALHVAVDAATASLSAAHDQQPDAYELARLVAMLCAYDVRWGRWAAGVEVLGVEVPFSCSLTSPVTGKSARTWRVAGKLDGLLRLADGRVAILEHKTRSGDASAGSDYRRALTLDAQVSTYFLGAEALGHAADLCIYDVLVKPSIKPLLATPEEARKYTEPKSRACRECSRKNPSPAPHSDPETGISCVDGRIVTDPGGRLYAGQRDRDETPDEYRERLIAALGAEPDRYLVHAEIVRSDQEREAHAWALWHAARSIEDARRAARETRDVRAVPQHASACLSHGSPCAYLPICEGTASARDETRFRRLPTVHPELSSQT